MKNFIVLIFLLCYTAVSGETSYMDIFLGEDRIGWYKIETEKIKSFTKQNENSKMSLTVYNNKINIEAYSFSVYDSIGNIVKFLSGVQSEQMSFYANGFAKNGILIVKSDISGSNREDTIDIKGKKILFNIESINKNLIDDNTYMYNPLTRKIESIDVKPAGTEEIKIGSKKYDSVKYLIKSGGFDWIVYADKEGKIVKSVSSEGIMMSKADTVKEVTENLDILNYFFINAEGDFKNIGKADKAVYIISGISNDTFSNYRQIQKNDTIIVSKSVFSTPKSLSKPDPFYLKAGKLVDFACAEIKKQSNGDSLVMLRKTCEYVFKKLKKSIYSGLAASEDILKNGYGDCTEHSQVFAAIALKLGFEADIVSGIVFSRDGFYYHAWNRVLYDGKIYTIDPTFNQFDADVSHIQLSAGFPPMKVLLKNISGKVLVKRVK